jgi:hypothetical protein
MIATAREFDLNIERVLEHWTVAYALREVIANALDEQALTGTPEPEILKDSTGRWHIRDRGRGLRYDHLTQKENKEKQTHSDLVIGKFGVGLKDAFATFHRHRVSVNILSPHGDISLVTTSKHGFDDIKTLHAVIHPPSDPGRLGTEVIMAGVKDDDIAAAKDMFLKYSGDEVLARTQFGAVLKRASQKRPARIYVSGLCVAEEERFLFSYDITSLTMPLRRALNRERTHVGRGAYTERVKDILLACTTPAVADALARDLGRLQGGLAHDELQWQDVQLHACRILNANEPVVFVTSEDLLRGGALITHARNDGYRVVVIPWSIASKLPSLRDVQGQPIRSLDEYRKEWDGSFQFAFVQVEQLRPDEAAVYALTRPILRLLPRRPGKVKEVLISETMRLNRYDNYEAVGIWVEDQGRIVIKRDQLHSVAHYAGTLLHECVHALCQADDGTLAFEQGFTEVIGHMAAIAVRGAEAVPDS